MNLNVGETEVYDAKVSNRARYYYVLLGNSLRLKFLTIRFYIGFYYSFYYSGFILVDEMSKRNSYTLVDSC